MLRPTAVIFPGQGAQRPGMALDFSARFPEARLVFEIASDKLGWDVATICKGEDARLGLTEFTQPCILTAEIAMVEALKSHFGFSPGFFGGHSLGEYAALVAAGAVSFEVAIELVHLRGKLMQGAAQPGSGAMAAVVMEGLPTALVQSIAEEFGVDVANDNSPNQVVLSGLTEQVEQACISLLDQLHTAANEIRVIPLSVSAPFHSRHMVSIEGEFRENLEEVSRFFKPQNATKVTSNFSGGFHLGSQEALVEALVRQLSGQVKWRHNMESLKAVSNQIFEVGPNRPLGGFFRASGIQVQSILDCRSAERSLGPDLHRVESDSHVSSALLAKQN